MKIQMNSKKKLWTVLRRVYFLNNAFTLFGFVIKVLFLCLQKYHELDVDVIRKDGLILIREMAAEVKNMMDIKMNAVMVSTVYQFLIQIG